MGEPKKTTVLVAGADGGFGRELYNDFSSRSDVLLYSMQRRPPVVMTEENIERWSQVNFSFPEESVGALRPLLDEGVRFDAVVVSAETTEEVEYDLCTAVDLERAWMSNIACPVMLCKYLSEFGMLGERPWFLFVVRDSLACGEDELPTRFTRAALPPVVRAFFRLGEFTRCNYTLVRAVESREVDHDRLIADIYNLLSAGTRPEMLG